MKTTKFALALAALTVITVASAQLENRNIGTDRVQARLNITLDESDLRTLTMSAAPGALTAQGGTGAGKAQPGELSLSHVYDKASPKLARVVKGTHFPTAIITVRKAGKDQQEYYTIKLTDVMVTSYQTTSGSGGDRPMESLSLNFTKIEFSYTPKKEK